ncbi:hypothetical protein CC1G_00138 [Coprinopsis cinerea okayama7|uniref:AMP-activated protein kinase glycogen-binding domain-containing protein n=1 Tax=Coprinopsis cinerea (strain Okayama-7 / 130 / ATCC MYA-4618 / FGSC 9003) TaxID=240176 RepID=A8NWW5_COPC7|nr:hypothetical protein CC1G_00138 [Coprinopsis cinerea okayama7\|eukprot:XP_001837002.1 hypothetical protein CC1G_00138 [Coprinopsis cinerea okayama7\
MLSYIFVPEQASSFSGSVFFFLPFNTMLPSPVEMTSPDLYNMFFEWPSTEPHEVIVTGTFDQWARTKHLNKTARGFVGTVKVPWGEKVKYKFVVDGRWMTLKGQPTEMDPGGYINNVFTVPQKPCIEPSPEEAPVETPAVSPAKPEAVEEKDTSAITSGSEAAAVSPPEAVEKRASKIPIVFVPLNSPEHNTVGSSTAPSPPDYVLPPSPRAAAVSAESPTVPAVPVEFHTALSSPIDKEPQVGSEPTEPEVPSAPVLQTEAEPKVEDEAPADVSTESSEVPKLAEIAPAEEPSPQVETPTEAREAPVVAANEDAAVPVNGTPPLSDVEKENEEQTGPLTPVESENVEASPASAQHEKESTAATASTVVNETPSTPTPKPAEAPAASLPTPPATPATPSRKTIPRASSPSPSFGSPKSKSGTISSRKKRSSIFGKLKGIFHHDKDKEKQAPTKDGKN